MENTIEKAIQKLKARNQNFVNKNGVTDYSRETDEIIKTIVDYYNQAQKELTELHAINTRFKMLLFLYNVPLHDFEVLPDWFLENESKLSYVYRTLKKFDEQFRHNLIFNFLSDEFEITYLLERVQFYRILDSDKKEWLLNLVPEIKPFINLPNEKLLTAIIDNYYDRTFRNQAAK